MANATLLQFKEKTQGLGYCFRDLTTNLNVYVKDFEDGILTLDPLCGTTIQELATMMEGCFLDGSNASEELFKVFSDSSKTSTL